MPEWCNSLIDNALHYFFIMCFGGCFGMELSFIFVYFRLFSPKNGQKTGKNTTGLKNSCKFAR